MADSCFVFRWGHFDGVILNSLAIFLCSIQYTDQAMPASKRALAGVETEANMADKGPLRDLGVLLSMDKRYLRVRKDVICRLLDCSPTVRIDLLTHLLWTLRTSRKASRQMQTTPVTIYLTWCLYMHAFPNLLHSFGFGASIVGRSKSLISPAASLRKKLILSLPSPLLTILNCMLISISLNIRVVVGSTKHTCSH